MHAWTQCDAKEENKKRNKGGSPQSSCSFAPYSTRKLQVPVVHLLALGVHGNECGFLKQADQVALSCAAQGLHGVGRNIYIR